MLLLLTGMETICAWCAGWPRRDRRFGAGIIIPFVCGAAGEFLPDSDASNARICGSSRHYFLGTALSIASIKIVAMVIREMNFMRRNLGQIIVASAIIDDSIGWISFPSSSACGEHGQSTYPR